MTRTGPDRPDRVAVLVGVALLAGLPAIGTASAQLVSLGGEDGLVSVGGDGLLDDGEPQLLEGSASASAAPGTVSPGDVVTVTFTAESAGLLDVSVGEETDCTVRFPDGREVPLCSSDATGLQVDLLGAGDRTLRYGLRAPAQPGTYVVVFDTDADLRAPGGSPDATAQFTVQPSQSHAGASGGEDGDPQATGGPDDRSGAPADGTAASARWLVDHPWVLVALAAVASVIAFRWASRAAPSR